MARALFATAIAQALVPVIALIVNRPPLTMGVLVGVCFECGLRPLLYRVGFAVSAVNQNSCFISSRSCAGHSAG